MPVPCPLVTFASFRSNFFAYFCPPTLKPVLGRPRCDTCVQRHTIKREYVEGSSRNAGPLPLCYLCFLLFKFLLLTSVRRP
jgi:hypothetical protein